LVAALRLGEPSSIVDVPERRAVVWVTVVTSKELVGNFKNAGRERQPQGEPELVDVHDFPSDAVGKAIRYGIYDVEANDGFVNRVARVIKKSCRTQLLELSKYCSTSASYSRRKSASLAASGLLSMNRFTGPANRSL